MAGKNIHQETTLPAIRPGYSSALLSFGLALDSEVPAEKPEPPWILGLQFYNVLSLVAFRPFGDVEFYVITFIQGFEATCLNSGMVHENIIP